MQQLTIKQMITDLVEAGYTLTAIAKVTGSTPATIHRALQGQQNNNLTLYRSVLEMWAMLAIQKRKAIKGVSNA